MTLYAMVKEIITTKDIKVKCVECGLVFKYPANSLYHPVTCGSFECEYKHQHPELKRGV